MPETKSAPPASNGPAQQPQQQPFVIALAPLHRGQDGPVPQGAVFRPRDEEELAAHGADVREATDLERRVAGV